MYLFSQPTLFPRDINVRSVTRELNKAIKERERKNLRLSIHFCQFVIGRGGGQPPPISSISIFFLSSGCYRSNHTSNRVPFNSLFLHPSFHQPTEKCWDLSSIFSLLSPFPPFFLFISFYLVHRAISEIDFSYPVDV